MMMWRRVVRSVRWRGSMRLRRRSWVVGGVEVAEARRVADAERLAGAVIDGCTWLVERSIEDLDLPLVSRALDRTTTLTGSQGLWRWLAAPAVRLDVRGRGRGRGRRWRRSRCGGRGFARRW
jgi:hypothetical protein